MEKTVYDHVKILWDYMHMHMELRPADCIVGFGNYLVDIARRSAQLYKQGYAPKILFSGGLGRNTSGRWQVSEAERFAQIAQQEGVPPQDILLENRSANTAENILFTRETLAQAHMPVRTILAVHQPFMERRIYAALKVYWPQVDAIVTSPQLTIEEHVRSARAQGLDEKTILDVIVGDFQRIGVYAEKGYQIPQEIPDEVREAFEAMVRLGYTGQLV